LVYPHPQDKLLALPEIQETLSRLMKDLGRDPGEDPLDVSTVMEFLRRDGDALSVLEEHHIWAMYEVARNNHLLASRFIPGQFRGDLSLFTTTADRTGEEPRFLRSTAEMPATGSPVDSNFVTN
jgi:hypothetical protein